MRRSFASLAVVVAACSRGSGGPPPDQVGTTWTRVSFAECGFSVEAPGAPEQVGLHLQCQHYPPDVAIPDPNQPFEIGISIVHGAVAAHDDVAPEPIRKPITIHGHPALGFRFAIASGRSAAGVLVLVDHRLDLIWTELDPSRRSGLDEPGLTRVIASYELR